MLDCVGNGSAVQGFRSVTPSVRKPGQARESCGDKLCNLLLSPLCGTGLLHVAHTKKERYHSVVPWELIIYVQLHM